MFQKFRRATAPMSLFRNWLRIYASACLRGKCSHVELRNGLVFDAPENGDLLDLVGDIFGRNLYLPEGIRLAPDDVVVDIGANVGVFSVYAAQRTDRRVYAFEPFPENFAFLTKNVEQNGASNVVPIHRAVSAGRGSAKLFVSESSGGHLLFDHNIKGSLDRYVEVPTLGFNDLFEEFGLAEIGLLKLDCEGSEGSILKHAAKDRLRQVRQIVMEYHDNVSELKHEQIAALFEQVGFKVRCRPCGQSPFGYLWAVRC